MYVFRTSTSTFPVRVWMPRKRRKHTTFCDKIAADKLVRDANENGAFSGAVLSDPRCILLLVATAAAMSAVVAVMMIVPTVAVTAVPAVVMMMAMPVMMTARADVNRYGVSRRGRDSDCSRCDQCQE